MKGLGFLKWQPSAVTSWFKGKSLLKKRPTKSHLAIGVGVLAFGVFVIVSFASGNTSTAFYGIGIAVAVAAFAYFMSSRAGSTESSAVKKADKSSVKAKGDQPVKKEFPFVQVAILGTLAGMFIVAQWRPPAGILIDVLVAVTIVVLYYKGYRSPKDVWALCEWKEAFKKIGAKAKKLVLALVTFKWSPLTFELEGTLVEFFFGWVPFIMKRSGVLIPVLRNPLSGPRVYLSWMRLEFIDIGLILYCFWTINDVLTMRANKESFTLYVYVSGFVINSTVLALSVLANRDGSRVRLGMYMLVGAIGLTNDILMTHVFALDGSSGWLSPRYAILAGVDGSLFILVCGYAIFHELILQPIQIGLSRRPSGLGSFSLPALFSLLRSRRGDIDDKANTNAVSILTTKDGVTVVDGTIAQSTT